MGITNPFLLRTYADADCVLLLPDIYLSDTATDIHVRASGAVLNEDRTGVSRSNGEADNGSPKLVKRMSFSKALYSFFVKPIVGGRSSTDAGGSSQVCTFFCVVGNLFTLW